MKRVARPPASIPAALRRAYPLMRRRLGHQHWWPGETPFEICVGAILTQNTSWTNVERAISNLKAVRALQPGRLLSLPQRTLARLLRPAGYFNVKTRRLRSFVRVLVDHFGGRLDRLFAGNAARVRERLLAIHGIGPETADSMLLYAGGHHSFVVDAYTRRIFHRHGWCLADADYDDLKTLCENSLTEKSGARRLDHWRDYHAQLVMVGKHFCRARNPLCDRCPLNPLLPRPVETRIPVLKLRNKPPNPGSKSAPGRK